MYGNCLKDQGLCTETQLELIQKISSASTTYIQAFTQEVSLRFDDYDQPLHSKIKQLDKFSFSLDMFSNKVSQQYELTARRNEVRLIDQPFQNPFSDSYDLNTSYLTF